jgi:fatty-acyl-CoA synthase
MGSDWFPKQTIGSFVDERARRDGSREALVFNGQRATFADLARDVDAFARGLIQLGIAPGDRVALWMTNRTEWVHAALAVMRIGAVLLPVNTRFRTEDAAYVLGQSDASVLIVGARSGPVDYLALVRTLLPSLGATGEVVHDPKLPALRRVVVLGDVPGPGTIPWPALVDDGKRVGADTLRARVDAVDPDATVLLMYTSGTTGFPKGVMHRHTLVRNVIDRAFRMAITPADTILNYLPLFHLFGFSEGMLMSMMTGARQIITESFDPAESLALIETERATIVHGFDTHFKDLLEAQRRRPRDVSSVRTGIAAAGMSSSLAIAREARALFGQLLSGYGMTEMLAGAALSALDSTEEQCTGASGYPAPGYEIRVIDPVTGQEQPTGVPGEIVVRGPMIMQGYYQKPEETAKAIDADGWLHSGDMGLMRPDGHLRFLGRYKDMLKIGGENVDPMEVEAYLMSHPGMNLVAVVALPDARLSEVPVAFVRCEAGHRLSEDDVIAYCHGKIASFKTPRHVVFVDDFPMTSSGKIQKVKLREQAQRRFTRPGG